MRKLLTLAIIAMFCFVACQQTGIQKKDSEFTKSLDEMSYSKLMSFNKETYGYLLDRLTITKDKDKVSFGKNEFIVTIYPDKTYYLESDEYDLMIWPENFQIRKNVKE
jgi:hypothetical protein